MRRCSCLQAALPPLTALALALIVHGTPPTHAQARSVERTLYVSALDKSGMPVEGLDADAFMIREDGARREILRVSRAEEPIDITVMIDTSMAATDEIAFVRSALPKFIAALAPAHRIALIGLAERPTILLPSTTDVKRLTSRAEGLFAQPGTGMTLLDAMVEVSDGLQKRDAARAAIVAIFTDGTEFTDRYSKDVVESLKKARVAVHLLSFGQFVEDIQHANRERNFFLLQGPKGTGGQHLTMLAPHALGANLDRVARELMSQYKVVYARPDTTIPPKAVEISSRREGLTVRGTPDRLQKGN
jgi:VWFA-related protein